MGYAFYFNEDGRPAGYGVMATCDKRGCDNRIDRGLGYLCGDDPHGIYSDEPGCGRYYCPEHLSWVGPRGGCSHRRRGKAWGETLACMVQDKEGTYCLYHKQHRGPHAWAFSEDEDADVATFDWEGGA